jgi:hypothetical protein
VKRLRVFVSSWPAFVCAILGAIGFTPVSAQTLNFAQVGSIAGPADMVRVQGRLAYVAAGKTLTLVDVSNPATPAIRGAYTFPEKIWGFRVAGPFVYVAADFFGLGILDVSNAAAPTLRGSFKTRGQAHGVAAFGTKVVVADHMSGLDLFDVSDLARPVLMDSFFLEGYARDVATSGSLAYAVDSPTGFYVIDLSKAEALEPVGTLQSANGQIIAVTEASTERGPHIACVAGGRALQVFDVSNPAAPVLVSTYNAPRGRPQRVSMKGALAYVAEGEGGLQVLDLSVPSKPSLVGEFKTSRPARDVAVGDSLVFVVVGDETQNAANMQPGGEALILRQTP